MTPIRLAAFRDRRRLLDAAVATHIAGLGLCVATAGLAIVLTYWRAG